MSQLCTWFANFTPDDFNKIALAVVAIIALFSGPLIQFTIAKRQVSMQEQIAKRQVEMQDEIAKRQLELQQQIARRQIADSISSRRQVWIDELRKDVSEYLTLISRLEELRRPLPNLSEEDEKKNFDEMAAANARAHELGIRMVLRLNATEGMHIEFVRLLGALADACIDPPPNETVEQRQAGLETYKKARKDVVDHVQSILKYEWERVKRGDL